MILLTGRQRLILGPNAVIKVLLMSTPSKLKRRLLAAHYTATGPVIAHAIETALKSNCLDRVIVSTDDQEIAEVPFMWPVEFSDDYAGTSKVTAHAVSWMRD